MTSDSRQGVTGSRPFARSTLAFAFVIGNHFMAADHDGRTDQDIIDLITRQHGLHQMRAVRQPNLKRDSRTVPRWSLRCSFVVCTSLL